MVVRYDGRTNLECGAISANVGIFNSLNGSAEFSIGLSKVVATVWRPEEASSNKCKSYLEVILRPRIGQAQESHKLMEYHILRLFEKVINFEPFTRCVISIALQIVSEDGPILPVCINAAALALIDSGIPMEFFPLAISIAESSHFYGEGDTSHLMLDPTQSEFLNCTNCSTIVVNTTDQNIFSCITNKGTGVSQNDLLDEIHPIILSIATSNSLIKYLSDTLLEHVKNKVVRPYNNNLF